MKRVICHIAVGAAIITLGHVQAAGAAMMRLDFSGTWNDAAATTFAGAVLYDSLTNDQWTTSPDIGYYYTLDFMITTDRSAAWQDGWTVSARQSRARIDNDTNALGGTVDRLQFKTATSYSSGYSTLDGYTRAYLDLRAHAAQPPGPLSSDDLPTNSLSLGAFYSHTLQVWAGNDCYTGEITAITLSDPTPVPEPGSAALLAGGLGMGAFGLRRNRRRQ